VLHCRYFPLLPDVITRPFGSGDIPFIQYHKEQKKLADERAAEQQRITAQQELQRQRQIDRELKLQELERKKKREADEALARAAAAREKKAREEQQRNQAAEAARIKSEQRALRRAIFAGTAKCVLGVLFLVSILLLVSTHACQRYHVQLTL
jgi:hypothetical protein